MIRTSLAFVVALAGCSANPPPPAATPASVAPSPAREAVLDAAAPSAVDAAMAPAVDAGPYLTGDARREHVMALVAQHRDVESCWSDALARRADHGAEAARVTLAVAPDGRADVTVDGVDDASLAGCIRLRLAGHRYGPGDALVADASYDLAPGG